MKPEHALYREDRLHQKEAVPTYEHDGLSCTKLPWVPLHWHKVE